MMQNSDLDLDDIFPLVVRLATKGKHMLARAP